MRLREKFHHRPRLLVITAVEAERSAVLRGLGLHDIATDQAIAAGEQVVVQACGVGCAAAAVATTRSLMTAEAGGDPFAVVVSAGIAGGFTGRAEPGEVVLASRSVAADLGADSPNGFLSLGELGFGPAAVTTDPTLLELLRKALPDAVVGDVLAVSTVTGTTERAEQLLRRHPDAAAEAMEGFGIAVAAEHAGAAFAELRAISNHVGPRDRAAWRVSDALFALESAAGALASMEP